MDYKEMTFIEKIALLSEADRAFIKGYVERAFLDIKKKGNISKNKSALPKPMVIPGEMENEK